MTGSHELNSSYAFTRAEVDEYLRMVTEEQGRLEIAIAHARARAERASKLEQLLASVEHRVRHLAAGAQSHVPCGRPQSVGPTPLLARARGTDARPSRQGATGDEIRSGEAQISRTPAGSASGAPESASGVASVPAGGISIWDTGSSWGPSFKTSTQQAANGGLGDFRTNTTEGTRRD